MAPVHYADLVAEAVAALKERSGSSLKAIQKYIGELAPRGATTLIVRGASPLLAACEGPPRLAAAPHTTRRAQRKGW